jgi:uncharacterized protein YgbK (DUF1537 family)
VIGRQSARTVGQIGLDTVRAGAPAVVAQLESLVGQGASIVVADAETEADLAVLGEVTAASDRVIGVGSAGLAGGLARSLGLAPVPAFDEPASTPTALGPVLCVVGSVNPVARGQLESLGATEPCRLVSVDVGRVLAGESALEAATAARMACQELRSGRCVALSLASDEAAHAAYRRRAETVGRGEVARELMAALGSEARLVLESGVLPAGLFLTGGDTARAVCRALGARGLLVEREVAAGIPQGRLLGGSFAGLPVVTKAGGFGESDALVRAVQVLRRVGN